MIGIPGQPGSTCDGFSRREFPCIRGVAALPLAILTALCCPAQTLDLKASGEVTMRPIPTRAVELYASSDLERWALHSEFTGTGRVDMAAGPEFYRAKVKCEPARIISISDSNRTLVGRCDKMLTNLVLRCGERTYQGWVVKQGFLRDTNVASADWKSWAEWRFPHITNGLEVEVTLHDEEGFMLVTNITLSPLPFTNRPPLLHGVPHQPAAPPNRFRPAADAQPGSYWFEAHSSKSDYWRLRRDGRITVKQTEMVGNETECFLNTSLIETLGSQSNYCHAEYTGPADWVMLQVVDVGPCFYQPIRPYTAWGEIANYLSGGYTNFWTVNDRLTRKSRSKATMYSGNYGAGTNIHVRVGVDLYHVMSRDEDEVYFDPADSSLVASIGGLPASGGYWERYIPEDYYFDATPALRPFQNGWYAYYLWFERLYP
jgi:hypothetical protein